MPHGPTDGPRRGISKGLDGTRAGTDVQELDSAVGVLPYGHRCIYVHKVIDWGRGAHCASELYSRDPQTS